MYERLDPKGLDREVSNDDGSVDNRELDSRCTVGVERKLRRQEMEKLGSLDT